MKKTTCRKCKKDLKPDWFRGYGEVMSARLQKNHECHTCDFWREKIEGQSDRTVIVNGVHFVAGAGGKGIKGMGGQLHRIMFLEDGRYIETDDLWHQGEIPELFRPYLQDNAIFLKKGEAPFAEASYHFNQLKKALWNEVEPFIKKVLDFFRF